MNKASPTETMPELKSDLAKFCFRSEAGEQNKRLAYANSICFCFVVLAVIGLKTPIFHIATPKPVEETVPILFNPPPEEPKFDHLRPDIPEPEKPELAETPQVVPVVAADPSKVAFSVPVEGPVILAPAKFAPPPPVQQKPRASVATPQPIEFDSGTATAGSYPKPDYPPAAQKRRMEGRVLLYVIVNERGLPDSVEVRDSSGWSLLDKTTQECVKSKWQWPAGEVRHYLVPFRFQIK